MNPEVTNIDVSYNADGEPRTAEVSCKYFVDDYRSATFVYRIVGTTAAFRTIRTEFNTVNIAEMDSAGAFEEADDAVLNLPRVQAVGTLSEETYYGRESHRTQSLEGVEE